MRDEPWPTASDEVVDRFKEAVAGIDGVEVRKMFGFPAAFIGGNMVAGTFRDSMLVRLPAAELEAREAQGWSTFEPMPGRRMSGFLTVPREVAADPHATRRLMEDAAAYVRTMPVKQPKERKARKR
jgi:TfoX/Sxy family transcriptional regulator of competence genes